MSGGRVAGASVWVAWVVVVELLVVATALPGLVVLALLAWRGPGTWTVPLAALGAVPFGPSLAAATFTWRRFVTAGRDRASLAPTALFWRGYRLNWRDALAWWVPTLVVLALLGLGMARGGLLGSVLGGEAGTGEVGALGLLALAAAVLVWASHALVLTALFSFRTRDVTRLAAYYLGGKPLVTLGVLGLLVAAAAVVVVTSDLLLVAAASPLVLVLVLLTGPVAEDVQERFVARP